MKKAGNTLEITQTLQAYTQAAQRAHVAEIEANALRETDPKVITDAERIANMREGEWLYALYAAIDAHTAKAVSKALQSVCK